jgi:hypothetical protein
VKFARLLLYFSAAFISVDACAAVSLPAVNNSTAVSARELFGEVKVSVQPTQIANSREQIANDRQIVQRAATQPKQTQSANLDVLTPRRPDANLWASNRAATHISADAPLAARSLDEGWLRMPAEHEFVRIQNDFQLPPEQLFANARSGGVQPTRANPINHRANPSQAQVNNAPVSTAAEMRVHQAQSDVRNPTGTIQNRFVPAKKTQTRSATVRPIAAPQRLEVREEKTDDDIEIERIEVNFDEEAQAATESLFAWAPTPELVREVAAAKSEDVPLNRLNPMELKRAFQKTYVSENKHLSTFRIDDKFDIASNMSTEIVGFESLRDLSEDGGIRPLEIKISFRGNDSSLSRDNFQLISEYAGLVVRNPKRAVQVSIPERSVQSFEGRRVAARRMAIIEQTLKDSGVPDNRIMPVLADRSDDAFVLRVISADQFQTMTEQKRDMFGDVVSETTSRRLAW